MAYRIAIHFKEQSIFTAVLPEHVFLSALFVFGVLFTLASPEAKFVSGGVIGNLFGNLYIPSIVLTTLLALKRQSSSLLALALFFTATLAYTHHLSTFILLYILAAFFAFHALVWNKNILQEYQIWFKILFQKPVILFFVTLILFAAFVTLPTYLETHAVSTAVGTPEKSTRTGLSFLELLWSNGPTLVFGTLAWIFTFIFTKLLRKQTEAIFISAWLVVLLVMTLAPALLLVNIPSNRIANYVHYPIALAALLFVWYALDILQARFLPSTNNPSKVTLNTTVKNPFVSISLSLVILFTLLAGLRDNAATYKPSANSGQALLETFHAAEYLAKNTTESDLILKDHNFIEAGDTWMKLFFNRGYNYPFSRSFFKRYEDNPDREQCTLAMIATPNTALGKQCFTETGVRFLIINPLYDQAQFLSGKNFSSIYQSPHIQIFSRSYEE